MAGHSRREEQGTSFGWTQSDGCLLACTFDGKCGSLAQECDGVPVSRLLDGCLLQLAQQADPGAPAASVPLCTVEPRGNTYPLHNPCGPDRPVSIPSVNGLSFPKHVRVTFKVLYKLT